VGLTNYELAKERYALAVKRCKDTYRRATILFGILTVAFIAIAIFLFPYNPGGAITVGICTIVTAVQLVHYALLWRNKSQEEAVARQ